MKKEAWGKKTEYTCRRPGVNVSQSRVTDERMNGKETNATERNAGYILHYSVS
jgi:hypothetical protein